MFVNGLASESAETALRRLGRGLGVEVGILPRWGEIVLLTGVREAPTIVAATPTGVDMSRVTATLGLVEEVHAGRLDRHGAARALDAIASVPPVSLMRLVLFAALGAAALGIIFGAGNLGTLAVIALSAGGGALLRRGAARISGNALLQPFAAAAFAGLVGPLAIRMGLGVDTRLVLLCPCMVLVPGPHVLNGTIDLVRSRIAIGAARIVFAGMVVLAISTGLLLGLALARVDLPLTTPPVAVPWIWDVLAAGVAVAAYGTFFNMPWRMLPVPILAGMLAHSLHWLLLSLGFSQPLASFAACLAVGICATPVAERLHYPFAALAFASVVSMMPGVFLFDGAAALVELCAAGPSAPPALLVAAAANLTQAALIVLGMTMGLIVPKMMLGPWFTPAP
ncbi:threonine/serine exporter family protein [Starkeya koreensis]|uniref:Threonine/serine exporter family protein n=2 Tax=Ancylobacter koreensis TaxID=266121 RepID=A0ABT0DRK2_9HYPH|nr:threonine/serine exporter family protein [Ancylobacter koreensis]